jgi:hypothetical protein
MQLGRVSRRVTRYGWAGSAAWVTRCDWGPVSPHGVMRAEPRQDSGGNGRRERTVKPPLGVGPA